MLRLKLEFREREGTDILIDAPPVEWQAYSENHRWETIKDVVDSTKGLNASGAIVLHLPKMVSLPERSEPGRYGVRVRVIREEYGNSPYLRRILDVASLGRTVDAFHLQEETDEVLGISDGSPGQRFRFDLSPIILPLTPNEVLLVDKGAGPETWTYVENFAWPDNERAISEKCFTVDVITNEVCLPPVIKQPNGEIKSYGEIPERGAIISFSRYRYGGDEIDVPRRSVNVLKTSIPYIDRVENREPALGGQAAVTMDALRAEVQRFLRAGNSSHLFKAVTAEDYEKLVRDHFPEAVGKVECRIENEVREEKGEKKVVEHIVVYVIAKIPLQSLSAEKLNVEKLEVSGEVLKNIDRVLYKHRLLTARVRGSNAQIIPVDIIVNLTQEQNTDAVKREIRAAVAAYLNPIFGGNNGNGWPLDQICSDESLKEYLERIFPGITLRSVLQSYEKNSNSDIAKLYIPYECTVNFE